MSTGAVGRDAGLGGRVCRQTPSGPTRVERSLSIFEEGDGKTTVVFTTAPGVPKPKSMACSGARWRTILSPKTLEKRTGTGVVELETAPTAVGHGDANHDIDSQNNRNANTRAGVETIVTSMMGGFAYFLETRSPVKMLMLGDSLPQHVHDHVVCLLPFTTQEAKQIS